MKTKFVWVILVLMSTIALSTAASAAPRGSNLHGEYSMVGTRTCVQVNGGADFVLPNYSLPSGGGSTRTTHYTGILKLHGNGTGELSNKVILINHNFGSFPIGQYNEECDATYQGLEDGTIQMSIANCLSKNLWPPPLANTFYSSTPVTLSVTVSSNGDTLLMSDAAMEPEVGTTWTCPQYIPGQPDCAQMLSPQKRICTRSLTAIRLSPKP